MPQRAPRARRRELDGPAPRAQAGGQVAAAGTGDEQLLGAVIAAQAVVAERRVRAAARRHGRAPCRPRGVSSPGRRQAARRAAPRRRPSWPARRLVRRRGPWPPGPRRGPRARSAAPFADRRRRRTTRRARRAGASPIADAARARQPPQADDRPLGDAIDRAAVELAVRRGEGGVDGVEDDLPALRGLVVRAA